MKTQIHWINDRWRFGALFLAALVIMTLVAWQSPTTAEEPEDSDAMHSAILDEGLFPSASKCKSCHEDIYREWASSNHAYSSISPMFHKFENAINSLAPTINAFCFFVHCFAPCFVRYAAPPAAAPTIAITTRNSIRDFPLVR